MSARPVKTIWSVINMIWLNGIIPHLRFYIPSNDCWTVPLCNSKLVCQETFSGLLRISWWLCDQLTHFGVNQAAASIYLLLLLCKTHLHSITDIIWLYKLIWFYLIFKICVWIPKQYLKLCFVNLKLKYHHQLS